MNWLKKFWENLSKPLPAAPAATTKVTVRGTGGDGAGNFTPQAQQVLALSRREADRLGHNFVGTEHVLFGILKLGQGTAADVLVKLGLDLETLRLEIEKQVGRGPGQKITRHSPFTPRVKKAFALAQKEARQLKHGYVGTEHILLGLIREGDGVAAKALNSLGVDFEKTRNEILKELNPTIDPASIKRESTSSAASSERQSETPPGVLFSNEGNLEDTSNFTPRAQQALAFAREEMARFSHQILGTEHLLLGLLALGQGVATNVLAKFGLNLESAREDAAGLPGETAGQQVGENTTYSQHVRHALALAQKERRGLHHTYLGTEHILLGLLREGKGAAATIMKNHGINLAELRVEILRELDPNFSAKDEPVQTQSTRDWISSYLKPDPIDITKRYDVYCIHHGESIVYRDVLFKSVKGLLQDGLPNVNSLYVELECTDGKSIFLPKSSIFKFADPGASAAGEKAPPPPPPT